MSAPLIVEWVLVTAGCAVAVLSALLALLLSTVFDMLHLLTAVTTVGAPLIGLGVAIGEGASAAAALVVMTVVIVAVTGPVVGAATARMAAQRDHSIESRSPR